MKYSRKNYDKWLAQETAKEKVEEEKLMEHLKSTDPDAYEKVSAIKAESARLQREEGLEAALRYVTKAFKELK